MSLELLPAELQIEILDSLDNSDLKAARAVSRKLRDNASPALFRSTVACARYEALGAFQKISLHPVLQKYVKEIVFDGSLYKQDLAHSHESYEQENDRHEHLRLTSFWDKRTRWKRYQELYTEQEDLKASGVLLQSIARALEWTTNVSSIVYSPHQHHIPVEAKVVRDLVPRGFRGRRGRQARLGDNSRNSLDHPFRQLIGAIFVAQYTGIRELRVEAFEETDPGNPFTFAFFDFPGSTHLQAGEFLFQNLERCILNIQISCRKHDVTLWTSDDVAQQRLANLNHLLAFADGLRYLAFHITASDKSHVFPAAMALRPEKSMYRRLGLQRTWPKLRRVSLGGIYAEEKDFLDLINRHRHTLMSLAFRQCTLYSGTWAAVVDEVVYNTRFLDFVLDCVDEPLSTMSHAVSEDVHDPEKWKYEGYLEVSKSGERGFVNSNAAKMSVYYLQST